MAANQSNVSVLGSAGLSAKSYSELCPSTPIIVQRIVVANSTDAIVVIGLGAENKETDFVAVGPGSTTVLGIGLNVIPKGSRISAKAIGNCSKGSFSVSVV